jgi:outer membrane murein-binding lipoprotein Lpp
MSLPTLFLGSSVTINGDAFEFNDSVVSVPTPVNTTDAVNKIYVDELVQEQTQRIDNLLAGTGVNLDQLKEISDYAAALNAAEQASLASAVSSLNSTIVTLQTYVNTTKSDLMAADVSILTAVST